jgi:large subunit ribosomal protein L24
MSLRIRKGDKVMVLAGKDKGKTGKVVHVYPVKMRALVQGINMIKKHQRKSPKNPQGGMSLQEMPIHLSNLGLLDSASGKPCRIKTLIAADGSKQRAASKSQTVIS